MGILETGINMVVAGQYAGKKESHGQPSINVNTQEGPKEIIYDKYTCENGCSYDTCIFPKCMAPADFISLVAEDYSGKLHLKKVERIDSFD